MVTFLHLSLFDAHIILALHHNGATHHKINHMAQACIMLGHWI